MSVITKQIELTPVVYFFLQVEPFAEACRNFFQRVANLEIEAFTGANVAGAVVHRVMVAEAITKLGLQSGEAVNYLKSHLVTNDSDFERVPSIKVWMPR